MTTSVRLNQPYYSTGGLLNAGETVGLADALATQMVAAGTAVLVNGGTPTASDFRGIGEAETPDEYSAAGGTLGDQQISGAVQGFLGGDNVTIQDGIAVPNSLL